MSGRLIGKTTEKWSQQSVKQRNARATFGYILLLSVYVVLPRTGLLGTVARCAEWACFKGNDIIIIIIIFIVNKAWQNARQHMIDTVERLRTKNSGYA